MTTTAPSTIDLPRVNGRDAPPIIGFDDGSDLLDIDFGEPLRPRLVTDILDRAIDTGASSADMPLTWRIAALVELCRQAGGLDPEFRVVCPGCEDELELLLSLSDVLAEAKAWELPTVLLIGADELEIRLPTGSDLERWARSSHAPIIADLGGTPQIPPEDVEAVLSHADPLVDFALEAECPECGYGLSVPIDLEAEALFSLEEARNRTLREVHRFASAYSWTEEQVLSVPVERRRRYLGLIEAREAG